MARALISRHSTPEDDAELIALVRQGKSVVAIAARLRRSKNAICRQGRAASRAHLCQSTTAITPITIAVLTAKMRNRVCSVTGRRYHQTVLRP